MNNFVDSMKQKLALIELLLPLLDEALVVAAPSIKEFLDPVEEQLLALKQKAEDLSKAGSEKQDELINEIDIKIKDLEWSIDKLIAKLTYVETWG